MLNENLGQGNNTLNQPNINPEDLEDLKCSECENIYFKEAIRFKRVSPLLTGNGKPALVPMPVIVCTKCNTVLDEENI